jgi:hypothetical protein
MENEDHRNSVLQLPFIQNFNRDLEEGHVGCILPYDVPVDLDVDASTDRNFAVHLHRPMHDSTTQGISGV